MTPTTTYFYVLFEMLNYMNRNKPIVLRAARFFLLLSLKRRLLLEVGPVSKRLKAVVTTCRPGRVAKTFQGDNRLRRARQPVDAAS